MEIRDFVQTETEPYLNPTLKALVLTSLAQEVESDICCVQIYLSAALLHVEGV